MEISALFWLEPPPTKPGDDFNGRLLIVDHLGNLHSTNRFKVKSREQRKKAPTEVKKEVVKERIHTIGNRLEKQAVAILKDEVIRYRECGRKSGGLGSVQVTYENRTLNGIGYQGRKANSPLQQWLVPDSSKAEIHSDNLASMLKLANDPKSRGNLGTILLKRIKSDSEYSSIGYFFLFALFRLGQLPAALKAIRTELIGDEDHAFDNSVMMLSGLLQYEYPAFDDRLLDEVERFSEGLDGSLHHLPERQTAARTRLASRLPAQPRTKQSPKRRPTKGPSYRTSPST
jgi:hypothetical protein